MGRTRLPEYAAAVRAGWTEGELLRLHLHELPCSLLDLSRERAHFSTSQRPPLVAPTCLTTPAARSRVR